MTDTVRDLTRQAAEMLGWWRQHGHGATVVFDRMRVRAHHEPAEQAACVISEDAPDPHALFPEAPSPDEVTPRV